MSVHCIKDNVGMILFPVVEVFNGLVRSITNIILIEITNMPVHDKTNNMMNFLLS